MKRSHERSVFEEQTRFPEGKFRGRFAKTRDIIRFEKNSKLGKNNKGRVAVEKEVDLNRGDEPNFPIQGSRILDLAYVSENMYCKKCKKPLLLQNIMKPDKPRGLGSTFHIRCEECETVTAVDSSRKYIPPGQNYHAFAINSRLALGNYNQSAPHAKYNC